MTTSRTTVLGIGVAALALVSCGQAADDGAASLQQPQPVRAVSAPSAAAAGPESDAALSSMPAFIGFTYEASPDLPALPTASTGYQYPPGVTIDAARVSELAAALGVEGEPVARAGRDVDGPSWRVGPDDGSAPLLTIGADAQVSIDYAAPWTDTSSVRCAESVDPVIEGSEVPPTGGQSGAGGDDAVASPPGDVVCEEPQPPANVPSADDAESLATTLLRDLGQDPDMVEFDTYADEWSASVTAWNRLDGIRSPVAWGFGFGENGALQWMNGALAAPVATGPYPLIGLDEALERLSEQSTWFGGGDVSITDVLPADIVLDPDSATVGGEAGGDAAVDVSGGSDTIPAEVATLIDVRADLWWAWDEGGSIWLLPAYTFTDTEGRLFTVPAVTDEFLIIPEPVLVEPLPIEPMPGEPSEPPVEVPEPDLEYVVGSTVDVAAEMLAADGWTMRVVIEDGIALAVTEDFSTSRVNVEVADGTVVAVVSIG